MSKFSIERNSLDYILTDIQPTELPEIFTYNYFYNYLDENMVSVENIFNLLFEKYRNDQSVFSGKWNTQPLVYKITKKDKSFRTMSLVQPLSALQISYFMRLYQKDILNMINSPHYSIRYHVKNNSLFYTSKGKYLIDYTYKVKKNSIRRSIERSNSFFKIKPHNSITSFINSNLWESLMIRYSHYLKTDYQSCFDSIYTHTYKWIIAHDSVDSKNLNNKTSNVIVAIDRVLQNVNGAVSNGVIVGPEFSRMIVELLLQKIDKNIYESLKRQNIKFKNDYSCFRYVDDIFVFTNSDEIKNRILRTIDEEASKFLLSINRKKTIEMQMPFVLNDWLKETKEIKDLVIQLFQKTPDENGEESLISFNSRELKNIKELHTRLIARYPSDIRSITSYILSVLLNKFSENKKEILLFKKDISIDRIRSFIDFVFYVYQFSTSFDNTQKFISVLYYLDKELDFKSNQKLINNIVKKYDVIFLDNHINDTINLLLTFFRYGLSTSYQAETKIHTSNIESKDPLMMASYLIYSRYDDAYFNQVLSDYSNIIENAISRIVSRKDYLMYKEMWYVMIFNKCPFISASLQSEISRIIDSICTAPVSDDFEKARLLVFDFIKNSTENFITWKLDTVDIAADITFRTRHRTIFKNFNQNSKIYDVSI